MEKRNRKAKFQSLILSVVTILYMAACGGVGGVFIAKIEEDYLRGQKFTTGQELFALAALLLLVFVIATLHIYIHETGHMIFGLLTGYRFQSIRFGSLMWVKTDRGIKFCRYSLAGTGGQCLMFQPSEDGDDYPITLYHMGGCIANLVVAALCLLIGVLVWEHSMPAAVLLISSIIGLGMALVNGIPLSTLSNDGYNVGVLRKDEEARKAMRIQLLVNGNLAQGKSVKDLPEEWFDWEEKVPENNLTCSASILR